MISIGVARGLLTLALMIAFAVMVAYVYSKRNKQAFDEAARLPLENENEPTPLTAFSLSATNSPREQSLSE